MQFASLPLISIYASQWHPANGIYGEKSFQQEIFMRNYGEIVIKDLR